MKRVLLITSIIVLMNGIPGAAAEVQTTTQDDQTNIEVTVYNSNLGLIKDTRELTLPKGEGELRFMDVASYIIPVSVHAQSLNAPNAFMVLEQNYEYDLMDQNKLLDKYVGKKMKLVTYNQYQDRKEELDAVLLSNNNGQVFQIGGDIYLGHYGYKVLPDIPQDLIAKPTLMWLFKNTSGKAHNLEVSYLTNNISWLADYVLVVNKADTAGDISGWVTVNNQSGATYRDAKLKLVAGEIQRAAQPMARSRHDLGVMVMEAKGAGGFQEEGFFEYHLYDLGRRTTIKDKQTKQISLLEAGDIKLQKEFLVYGIQSYYSRQYRSDNPKQPVEVYIKFKNEEKNNLGMPLPAGTVRLYKKDKSGSLQLIGENRIDHTPKDEEIKLKVGEAFDVVAERRQTDFRQVTTRMYETAWEVILKNHKEEDITVGIIEPLHGSWSVIENSHTYAKEDAFTIRFDVEVPRDKEVKVTYRVRVGI